jgi:hypothetical protein
LVSHIQLLSVLAALEVLAQLLEQGVRKAQILFLVQLRLPAAAAAVAMQV